MEPAAPVQGVRFGRNTLASVWPWLGIIPMNDTKARNGPTSGTVSRIQPTAHFTAVPFRLVARHRELAPDFPQLVRAALGGSLTNGRRWAFHEAGVCQGDLRDG